LPVDVWALFLPFGQTTNDDPYSFNPMTSSPKKPGVAFWATIFVVAAPVGLMLYVAAAPVLMYVACECPDPYRTWASEAGIVYRPLYCVMDHCPALSHLWYLYMDHWP
jgi:hypothetical protein